MGISPRELTELLGRAGYQVTERRLGNWRAEGWTPEVSWAQRPAGTGRGAYYEWPDTEIIAQVVTLLSVWELRGRMKTAGLLAWFTGFDVPRDNIRDLWVKFEESPWEKTLNLALGGEPGSVRAAVDALVNGERRNQHKKKDGFSDRFVDVIVRMGFDPDFDASTELPSERLATVLAGHVPEWAKHGAELASALFPDVDVVRGLLVLAQDYVSAPRLIKVIRTIPDAMLASAHGDVRFLLSPYCAWVESGVRKAAGGGLTGLEETLLWTGPRVVWRLGRRLLQVDIALRQFGFAAEVDETIAMLRDIAANDAVGDVVKACKQYWPSIARVEDPDPGLADDLASSLLQELKRHPAFDKSVAVFRAAASALRDLWMPRLRLALTEAAAERPGDSGL
ncbi:MAG: hypothetical protein J2P28_01120 [Actinobacteria bacterium]|nr:hypothetical protein [Actinomycetota bacterium]MBO0834102.1 hypothetical protein [Actinomycetota bacterium]